jgi:hypothetical protein
MITLEIEDKVMGEVEDKVLDRDKGVKVQTVAMDKAEVKVEEMVKVKG